MSFNVASMISSYCHCGDHVVPHVDALSKEVWKSNFQQCGHLRSRVEKLSPEKEDQQAVKSAER